jgi:hypothetical protein
MVYNLLLFDGGVGGLMHGFQWFSRWFCYHKENIDFILGFGFWISELNERWNSRHLIPQEY